MRVWDDKNKGKQDGAFWRSGCQRRVVKTIKLEWERCSTRKVAVREDPKGTNTWLHRIGLIPQGDTYPIRTLCMDVLLIKYSLSSNQRTSNGVGSPPHTRGILDRFSFRISENNRRRLEILKAFSVLDGKNPTLQDLVNESIELFFVFTYERYCLTFFRL